MTMTNNEFSVTDTVLLYLLPLELILTQLPKKYMYTGKINLNKLNPIRLNKFIFN